ncbi:MAG: sensor histidine kinase, partial [Thermomicrobiales bacterium]
IFGIFYGGDYDDPGEHLSWVRGYAQENIDRWTDPTWQVQLGEELDDRDVEAVFKIDGIVVYSTADTSTDDMEILQYASTFDRLNYQADFFAKPSDGPPPAVKYALPIAILAVVGVIAGVAIFLRRAVIDPLAATSKAASRVAVGELDVHLPNSRVREVAEVNAAFGGMSVALKESLETQAKLEEERRLFIGAIAHDLRTPLFSLRGSLEGLATGIANTPEKQEQYLNVAREKADKLERLIADLFDFTRLEYLEQPPQRERIDLNELLQRSIDGIAPQAETKRITLLHESPTAPLVADADVHMLSRAVENVLDNALRHTPEGGTVTIQSGIRGTGVWFTIADTGSGIAEADLPHIFTPLYRSDASRNSRTGGAGLGLSIARNMLRAHGGDLTARNSETGGAIFEGTMSTS